MAEADESDASFLKLGPEVAIVNNVEMDHHSRWGSLAELTGAFARFAESADVTVLPDEGVPDEVAAAAEKVRRFGPGAPGPAELSLAVPGAHNALNARAAIAALAAAGEDPEAAAAALADFPGVRRRLELKGTAAGARVYDDYAHHPTEVRAALSALRELAPDRLVAVFQPHLYSRTKAMAADFGSALALADEIVVLDVYPAREEPVGDLAGVSGLDVARAAADRAGGRRVLWAPALDDATEALRHSGRRRVDRGHARRRRRAPGGGAAGGGGGVIEGLERDYPLARLTTVRTGGAADWFVRPETTEGLVEALAWARDEGLAVGVIGSGSNLLVADDGFRGLAMKLDGELAEVQRDGERLILGGGARLPSVAAKTASWGLAGLEFGVNIPGTVGGAVRMNANAYGGELARTLEWAEVASADGAEQREPESLGFVYRNSNLGPGEVVSRASFHLTPAPSDEVRETLGRLRSQRREAQPSGIKTFGSTFKNPDAPEAEGRTAGQLLEAAGCRGLQRGGARFSEVHANFVENMGEATTRDVLEVMSAGRRRVAEQFGVILEPEVQALGDLPWPDGLGDRVTAVAVNLLPAAAPARGCAGSSSSPRSRRCSEPSTCSGSATRTSSRWRPCASRASTRGPTTAMSWRPHSRRRR